jgi:hypothetical protein
MEVVAQNLAILGDFQPLFIEQMQTLRNNVSNSRMVATNSTRAH